MRRFQFLLLTFVLTFTGLAGAQGITAKFDPQRDAAKDVAAAVAAAKVQGKNVLVDVGGEWCKWCHFLDKFIETTPEVKNALDQNFVWVKVNWSPENKNVALLSQWPKISGYPHLFVLDTDGKLLHSQNTGDLEAEEGKNTYNKQKVMAFIGQTVPKK
jgi:thioredoxin-related protein